MATAVTTTWQTVKTAYSSFTWSGNTYYITIELQAYYLPYSATQATIYLREKVTTSNSVGWSGTNKHYRVRFYPDEGGSGDSGYNQDATQWYAPGASYYLPDDWGSVHKVVNYGATVSAVGYYLVDAAPSSEVGLAEDLYVNNPTTPPTGLAVSNLTPGVDSFTGTVSITGWGTGGSSADRYLELQCWTNGMVQPRRYNPIYTNNLSATITVDNNSKYTAASGPLTIVPNTTYTIGAYASNGGSNTDSQRIGEYTTLAKAPSIHVASKTATSVTFGYDTESDGGQYTKTLSYSLDNGTTWVDYATVSTGSATSGTFTISGLTVGDTYTMLTKVTTTAGTTNGVTFTIDMNAGPTLYGSANNQAQKTQRLYGSVGGQTVAINKLYASVNGEAKRIY